MTKNESKIIGLLNAGYSVSEVSEELEVKKSRIYTVAKKHKLPFNSTIKSGGPKEMRILRLFKSGFSVNDIGKIFSQAPKNIQKIIDNHTYIKK
jgi:DNA-binding NarL/FixJ family response regulator